MNEFARRSRRTLRMTPLLSSLLLSSLRSSPHGQQPAVRRTASFRPSSHNIARSQSEKRNKVYTAEEGRHCADDRTRGEGGRGRMLLLGNQSRTRPVVASLSPFSALAVLRRGGGGFGFRSRTPLAHFTPSLALSLPFPQQPTKTSHERENTPINNLPPPYSSGSRPRAPGRGRLPLSLPLGKFGSAPQPAAGRESGGREAHII